MKCGWINCGRGYNRAVNGAGGSMKDEGKQGCGWAALPAPRRARAASAARLLADARCCFSWRGQ